MASKPRIEVARSADELAAHRVAWEHLAARSAEDNLYACPGYLTVDLARYGEGRDLRVLLVYDGDLIGLWPFEARGATRSTPLSHLAAFAGPHDNLAHPLVDAERGAQAVAAMWDWIACPGNPWRLVLIDPLLSGSPVAALVEREIARRGLRTWIKKETDRAVLSRHADFDAYLASLPTSRRKDYRRKRRALEGEGSVEAVLHRDLVAAPNLAERFMALEAAGWKGGAGTALSASDADAGFFSAITAENAARGALFFVELKTGGRTVAMTTNFVCGTTLFAFKTAYDPAFERFSPGIVCEVEGVRLFHETADLTLGDGGNTEGSYVLSYWRDRRVAQTVAVATGDLASRAFLAIAPALRRLTSGFRAG